MIILRISDEAFTDIFTPGVVVSTKCVEGLPRDITLQSVELVDGLLTFKFDDGKVEEEIVKARFEI